MHEVLDWFEPLHEVIALRPVLIYCAIKIGSSLFLLGSFEVFRGYFQVFSGVSRMSWGCLEDLSYLFIVEEPHHKV
jgi:hypothetical protein